MAIPVLSAEERQAALEKAREARQKRSQIRRELEDGSISFEEVLGMKSDEIVGRMKVTTLLDTLPGVGVARAEKIMKEAGIAPSRRLAGLGCRQVEALIAVEKKLREL